MVFVGTADVLTVLLGLFVISVVLLTLIPVLVVFAVRSTYRRLRRDPRWNRAALIVQEKTNAPGPRRHLLHLRVRVQDSIVSARMAVSVLQAYGHVQGELASLVRRLEPITQTLDAQLRLMQSEPDMRLLQTMLGPVQARVVEIEAAVRHIRGAAYAAIGGDMEESVAMLTADIAREVAALQAGMQALRTFPAGVPTPIGLPLRKERAR